MIHLFIVNPAAGKYDRTEELSKIVGKECGSRGLTYRIAVSQGPGDCARIAREAAQTGEEYRIYACGGDGTLNEVVSGVIGYENVAISCFCGGSGNDFVKIFDDPAAFRELPKLLDAEESTLDLIKCNDDYSLNITSVGLDARIGTQMAAYKRLPLVSGPMAYILSTVVNLFKRISERYIVEIDGETIDAEQTFVCACNGRFYGGGFNPVPEALPDDGMMDVLMVKKVNIFQVPGIIGKYKNGRYKELHKLVRHYKTKELTIKCFGPTPINLDGELRTAEEMHIRMADEKLRFFYPKCTTYRLAEPTLSK